MALDTPVFEELFVGHQRPPLVGSPDSYRWRKRITGAAPPTVQTNNGLMECALTATNEAQVAALTFGDDLSFALDRIEQVDMWVRVSASLNAACSAAWGVASAGNDTVDSITAFALFRVIGNNNVVCETDDNVIDINTVATGMTLANSIRKFSIKFAGVQTVAPPGLSKGGKANIEFSMEQTTQQGLRRVAINQLFDMSNYSGNLQPYFQMQKSASTATGTLGIERFRIAYRQ